MAAQTLPERCDRRHRTTRAELASARRPATNSSSPRSRDSYQSSIWQRRSNHPSAPRSTTDASSQPAGDSEVAKGVTAHVTQAVALEERQPRAPFHARSWRWETSRRRPVALVNTRASAGRRRTDRGACTAPTPPRPAGRGAGRGDRRLVPWPWCLVARCHRRSRPTSGRAWPACPNNDPHTVLRPSLQSRLRSRSTRRCATQHRPHERESGVLRLADEAQRPRHQPHLTLIGDQNHTGRRRAGPSGYCRSSPLLTLVLSRATGRSGAGVRTCCRCWCSASWSPAAGVVPRGWVLVTPQRWR